MADAKQFDVGESPQEPAARLARIFERAEQDLRRRLTFKRNELQAEAAQRFAKTVQGASPIDGTSFSLVPWSNSLWSSFNPEGLPLYPRLTRVGDVDETRTVGNQRVAARYPAALPVVGGHGIAWVASGDGLDRANECMQAVLLRLLATTRPGKLRLTLIDPRAHGQSFAHLSGFPPLVVGDRVLYDWGMIEDKLSELIDAMSNVIQKYLRNEYADILAYNERAGEVEEPFRIVAVANLPEGMPLRVWELLVSIAKNGWRAGYYVLASWDRSKNAAHRVDPDELLRTVHLLSEKEGGFVHAGMPELGETRLDMDAPPSREIVQLLERWVGEQSKHADVVQVPFDRVLPESPWSAPVPKLDHDVISVPLGRAGAHELQMFTVQGDKGNHALVAGQTGAGKSVLLHTLVLSLAHHFHPRDVEFYLIDLKEGVEFGVYRRFPHARVVAIQSEREFAWSVLKGLVADMKRRGERFLAAGVRTIKHWRSDPSRDAIPYIFLVVDEFQVLFERNDRVATECRGLLDTLAREGRGFGIHIVLATQTLSSLDLEPSTLSQLVIRIALQMSETDSMRVLSKENDQAKLLTRAGHAIYNDGSGETTKNHFFQVAYLSQEEQESRVRELEALAGSASWLRTPVVFDGTAQSAIQSNPVLTRAMREGASERLRALPLYVGEPMAVQEGHVDLRLRRQGRSNILLIGSEEEPTLATFAAICLSARYLSPPGALHLSVLDMTNVDSPFHDELGGLASDDGGVEVFKINQRKVDDVVTRFHAELEQRLASDDLRGSPTWILALFGFQRARTLHKEGASPTPLLKHFLGLLRDGPDVGLHVLLSADSVGSLTRGLDPRDIEEFESRVVFTSSDGRRLLADHGDSVTRLKSNFGLAYVTDRADEIRKFKCYSLASIREALAGL